jgi:SAM-dependent methyltransferase
VFAGSVVRSGVRSALAVPFFYRAFGRFIGGNARSLYVESYVRVRPGDRVLDIGCGPGDILSHLPPVDYVGLDSSEEYIQAARKRFGDRGRFLHTPVRTASIDMPASFDLVLATGVLHHLDDSEALDLFRLARQALKPEGRLVTLDGCYLPGQSRVAKLLLRLDRGKFVRTQEGYTTLASQIFRRVEASIRHDLLRLPYTHIILECGG